MTTTTKRKKGKNPKETSKPSVEFRALVASARGAMSWLNVTVDGYLRDKHVETDAENGK